VRSWIEKAVGACRRRCGSSGASRCSSSILPRLETAARRREQPRFATRIARRSRKRRLAISALETGVHSIVARDTQIPHLIPFHAPVRWCSPPSCLRERARKGTASMFVMRIASPPGGGRVGSPEFATADIAWANRATLSANCYPGDQLRRASVDYVCRARPELRTRFAFRLVVPETRAHRSAQMYVGDVAGTGGGSRSRCAA